jgi:ABC-type multidrug transport system ATPase subunit
MSTSTPTIDYPALLDCNTRRLYSLRDRPVFAAGRSQHADLILLDPACSREQFRIRREDDRYLLEPQSERSPTDCNGQRVVQAVLLTHGAVIGAGVSRFRFLERPETAVALLDTPTDGLDKTRMYDPSQPEELPPAAALAPVRLCGRMLIGRDPRRAQIHLPHPQVSRLHAEIVLLQPGMAVVSDQDSENGTYVNGQRVRTPTTLRTGDRIDIGPYGLTFADTTLQPSSRADNVTLVARHITRVVTNAQTGRPLTLLDDISLVVRPGEFVCILGPSGSGKSTLLLALSARVPANEGQVTINGLDFYQMFDALKQDVVVVPQRDALHELLTVSTALDYAAQLRLPRASREERQQRTGEMLAKMKLTGKLERQKIFRLSGGQLKRASLATEIVSGPSLLFLDEVTSGLDEETDREMMSIFRDLARSGKTVLCITHNLANVEDCCTHVVILTEGGRLAFFGSPEEAKRYFGISRLGQVYPLLTEKPHDSQTRAAQDAPRKSPEDAGREFRSETRAAQDAPRKSPEDWKREFRSHACYRKYVLQRLPAEQPATQPDLPQHEPSREEKRRLFVRQLGILAARYTRIQFADVPSLLTVVGQCILVAVLLVLLFGDLQHKSDLLARSEASGQLLFLLGVSCLWLGCNNSAKEIVKERIIYERERNVNLLPASYYASKVVYLWTASFLQVTLLFAAVKWFTNLEGSATGQWLLLVLLAASGVTIGLLISAVSKTPDTAVTIVPMALIPQIALSGAVAKLSAMSEFLAQFLVTLYWGYRGLTSLLPGEIADTLQKGENWSLAAAVCMVLLHTTAFVTATLVLLVWPDLFRRAWARVCRRK